MKTYKIYTLGCKVNQYDSGKLAGELARAGLSLADKNANLAVINSCAVTKTAMIKSRRMISKAKKENPEAKVILAGCWPRASGDEVKKVGADLILRDGNIKNLVKQIFKQFNNFSIIKTSECHNLAITDKGRYFIKIQDGCEQYCSYCIIPYARGKLTSRPAEEIIAEIKQAIKAGYGEIVLSGIHLGLYGNDNNNLTGLLKKLVSLDGLGRIRLSSIEITEVSDELINLTAEAKKICSQLHIPLQSGSDKILKLMNRPYDARYFKNKIKQIRRALPDIAITTDVIAGFPGETEKDFKATEKFSQQINFSRLHVFPFSAHEKTPAAKMPNQVAEKTKARRAKILRELGVKLAQDYKKKFEGRELEIAIEQIKQDKIIGQAEYYFEVEVGRKKIRQKDIKIGEIIRTKI